MTETFDTLGPVDWLVLEFPGKDFGKGSLAPILQQYVDQELIRVLDMVFLQKEDDGSLEVAELNEFGDTGLEQLRAAETELAMVLSEQDVLDLAETIEPGRSAALLVYENLWAAPFGSAVRNVGGELVASGRIPTQALIAAMEADAEAAELEGV